MGWIRLGIEFKAAICPRCGADIHFAEDVEQTQCPYCGVSVFIDRNELRVRIIGKPINFALFEKVEEEVLKRVVLSENHEAVYSINALARLMADCDDKVFPYPKSEVKRFAEWVNGRIMGRFCAKMYEKTTFIATRPRKITFIRFYLKSPAES